MLAVFFSVSGAWNSKKKILSPQQVSNLPTHRSDALTPELLRHLSQARNLILLCGHMFVQDYVSSALVVIFIWCELFLKADFFMSPGVFTSL